MPKYVLKYLRKKNNSSNFRLRGTWSTDEIHQIWIVYIVYLSCLRLRHLTIKYSADNSLWELFVPQKLFLVAFEAIQPLAICSLPEKWFSGVQKSYWPSEIFYVRRVKLRNIDRLLDQPDVKDIQVYAVEDNIDHNVRRWS